MRKIVSSAVFALVVMLTGCGTVKVLDGVEVRCSDKNVTVVNAAGRLQVSKDVVEVCRGNSVVLKFRNSAARNTVHTRQPPGAPTPAPWLNVDNTDTEQLTIMVPPETTPARSGDGYKYTLQIDGLGTLDPRIVVQ